MKKFSEQINEWRYSPNKNVKEINIDLYELLTINNWSTVHELETRHPIGQDIEGGIKTDAKVFKRLDELIKENGSKQTSDIMEYVVFKNKFLSPHIKPTYKIVATKFVFRARAYYIVPDQPNKEDSAVHIYIRGRYDSEEPISAYDPSIDNYNAVDTKYNITVEDAEIIEKFIDEHK